MEFLYEIAMDAELHDVGATPNGHRRIVSVTGGTFEPAWSRHRSRHVARCG
jgi:hypothetical protein